MGTFFTDTSYFQVALNNSYPHPFVSFRIADGGFIDPLFSQNYATAKSLTNLAGFIGYYVFRPSMTPDEQYRVIQDTVGAPHPKLVVMIDVESWGGQIGGNHSTEINSLISKLASWLGSTKRVIAYGNQSDLANIYPDRPASVKLVVASYGSYMPYVNNMIAWQYSDGQTRWPVPDGFPRATPPFGSCDHNYSSLNSTDLAVALGVGSTKPVSIEDEVMGYYSSKAAFEAAVEAAAETAAKKVLASVEKHLHNDHVVMLHGDPIHPASIASANAALKDIREVLHSIGLRVDALTKTVGAIESGMVTPDPAPVPAPAPVKATPVQEGN